MVDFIEVNVEAQLSHKLNQEPGGPEDGATMVINVQKGPSGHEIFCIIVVSSIPSAAALKGVDEQSISRTLQVRGDAKTGTETPSLRQQGLTPFRNLITMYLGNLMYMTGKTTCGITDYGVPPSFHHEWRCSGEKPGYL